MKKKKLIIIGLLIVIVFTLGNSYKPLIYKIFNDYEESCLTYKIYYWNETYCTSTMYGIDYKNNNEEHPCCGNETFELIWSNGTKSMSRWCSGIPFNKTLWEFTDECDVYHLVRKR